MKHSFTLPTLEIKIDAIPGRVNSIVMSGLVPGLYVGYCSELCGSGHAFMPINLIVYSPSSCFAHLRFAFLSLFLFPSLEKEGGNTTSFSACRYRSLNSSTHASFLGIARLSLRASPAPDMSLVMTLGFFPPSH